VRLRHRVLEAQNQVQEKAPHTRGRMQGMAGVSIS